MKFLSDFHLCASVNALSAVMTGWTSLACDAPEDARWAFVVPDEDAFSHDFWAALVKDWDFGPLNSHAPVVMPGVSGCLTPETLYDELPAGNPSVSVAYPSEFSHGMTVYACQWGSHDLPPVPDLEVEPLERGGFAVRWAKVAETVMSVMDHLVAFVVANGFAIEPEEE